MRKYLSMMMLLLLGLQLAGCETLKGVSKDLNRLGENIEENLIKNDKE